MNPDETRALPAASRSSSEGRKPAVPSAWEQDSQLDADDEAAFKPLTPDEARALRAANPALSPWAVVAAQAVVGLVCVLLWSVFAGVGPKAWSALYGAIAVVAPNALMAWGATRRTVTNAGAALLALMFWELIKILLVIAILVAVIKRVPDLSWPAMLLTLILCLKVNWLVPLWWGRFKKISDGN